MAISRTPLALALGVAMQIMAASNTKAASITNLGNFGCPSDGSDAVGINASGQVAGGSRTVASGCNSNSAYLYSGGQPSQSRSARRHLQSSLWPQ